VLLFSTRQFEAERRWNSTGTIEGPLEADIPISMSWYGGKSVSPIEKFSVGTALGVIFDFSK